MVCRRKKDRARNRGTCPIKQNLTSNPNHVKVKGILGHISWENSWCLVAFKRLLALILSHHFRHTHTEVPQMQGPRVVVQLPSLIQLIATHGLQHTRLPCPSPAPGVCPSSCPLNQWCHPTISSSVIPLSSCLQSFPASGTFPMSQLFVSGG